MTEKKNFLDLTFIFSLFPLGYLSLPNRKIFSNHPWTHSRGWIIIKKNSSRYPFKRTYIVYIWIIPIKCYFFSLYQQFIQGDNFILWITRFYIELFTSYSFYIFFFFVVFILGLISSSFFKIGSSENLMKIQ